MASFLHSNNTSTQNNNVEDEGSTLSSSNNNVSSVLMTSTSKKQLSVMNKLIVNDILADYISTPSEEAFDGSNASSSRMTTLQLLEKWLDMNGMEDNNNNEDDDEYSNIEDNSDTDIEMNDAIPKTNETTDSSSNTSHILTFTSNTISFTQDNDVVSGGVKTNSNSTDGMQQVAKQNKSKQKKMKNLLRVLSFDKTMEECAPLPLDIYRKVGFLLLESWKPLVESDDDLSSASRWVFLDNDSISLVISSYYDALFNNNGIQPYHQEEEQRGGNHNDDDEILMKVTEKISNKISLSKLVPSVRTTAVVKYWIDLNVIGGGSRSSVQQQMNQGSNKELSPSSLTTFSHLLLYNCYCSENDNRISILDALFHHVSMLPQLQHEIHTFTQSIINTSTINKKKVTTEQRIKFIKISQYLLDKLTTELDMHLANVEYVLGMFYTISPPTLRSLMRKYIGRLLTSFINENSHRSGYRPQIGSGRGQGRRHHSSHNSENTSACGIDIVLKLLLRILRGMNTSNSPDDKPATTKSTVTSSHVYEDLLFNILLPLHRPSGMILWRDQTPILQLYHEQLVQCIASLILTLPKKLQKEGNNVQQKQDEEEKLKSTLISKVIIRLLETDIWPTVSPSAMAAATGATTTTISNTPKAVLLLHEIDTYLNLFPISLETTIADPQKQAHMPSHTKNTNETSNMLFLLTKQLCICIESDNSRISEQSLQFFKNKKFISLLQNEIICPGTGSNNTNISMNATTLACNKNGLLLMNLLLKALCRCNNMTTNDTMLDSNNNVLHVGGNFTFSIPWNPTVRKMTKLVLNELESSISKDLFIRYCNIVFDDSKSNGERCSTSSSTAIMDSNRQYKKTKSLGEKDDHTQRKNTQGEEAGNEVEDSNETGPHFEQTRQHYDFSLKSDMGDWKPPTVHTQSPSPQHNISNKSNMMLPPPPRLPSSQVPKAKRQQVSNNKNKNNKNSNNNDISKPPPRTSQWQQKQPPLTVTGVAPWAVRQHSQRPSPFVSSSTGSQPKEPPLTITGVAPWAMSSTPPSRARQRPHQQRQICNGNSSLRGTNISEDTNKGIVAIGETIDECGDGEEDLIDEKENGDARVNVKNNSGYERVCLFLERLQPSKKDDQDDHEDDGISSWAKAQMAESPTLLPSLKFHDLVFGHDLGSGAFGSVRYARRIIKGKTRSSWPEYAVKVVDQKKIEALGYEQSINREIATLRVLSHPGIARLISSFRFRDGAYLVLEYASRGDLHTLLRKNGSLDLSSSKFVVGEIVAALCSIHDLGFLYGDLKPENVLITEAGHIKLTDFGACRPLSDSAKELINAVGGMNAINKLRDGDWKSTSVEDSTLSLLANAGGAAKDDGKNESIMAVVPSDSAEDHRIEGTTAYLPPEVCVGNLPTLAADTWALGCVLYQCISGRPPILEDDDDRTRHKIVAFHLPGGHDDNDDDEAGKRSKIDDLFDNSSTSSFTTETQDLVRRLLHREPARRPTMIQVANDTFFSDTNAFDLYKKQAHPLDAGDVQPVADAKWSRRQFSSIWAPQPRSYSIHSQGIGAVGANSKGMYCSQKSPIPEGSEAASSFSTAIRDLHVRNIPENAPMLIWKEE